MEKITVYHNPRCSKSRGACTVLNENKLEFETVEYIKKPPTKTKLKSLLKMLGMKPIDLIRKDEDAFKKYKNIKLTDEKLIELMIANPILIERPIVVVGKKAVIARPPELILELL
ncbi:MAG: arsenate reductase (glutaredoxin) [Bacteroidota bacterium]|nr:arsenate reductase (glutaredoxin) [Bacteroidota bacterium]